MEMNEHNIPKNKLCTGCSLLAREQLTEMGKTRDADERVRIMLDATPLCAHFWGEDLKVVDCNQAAVTLFKLSSKQEYIDRYFDLTPEFQPDGSRSTERLKQLLENTCKEGYQRVEWMRQTLDGEPLPVELTLVRVDHKGQNLVAGYCRDLREQKRMLGDIEKRDQLLNVINQLALTLLTAANEGRFDKTLLEGMELIGHCLDADCVQVWPNEMRDGVLHFVLRYKWLSEVGKKAPPVAIGTAVPYSKRWMDLFLRGECVNGPIAELPQEDQDLLGPLGLTSTITIPLYYQGEFWGVFCVDDCIKKRYFTEGEISLLHSAALMLVNAINRNAQASQISDTAANLKTVVANYPGAICSVDKDYRVTLFDGLLAPQLVDTELFFSGQDLHVALRREELRHILGKFKSTMSEGPQDWSFELNGRIYHMATTQIINDKGEATGVMAKVEDVTEMIKIQRELEIQLAKLNLVLKATKIGLWDMTVVEDDLLNPMNPIVWSDEFRQLLGYVDEREFPNQLSVFQDCLHPEDRERTGAALARHLLDKTGKTPYNIEYRAMKKSGEYAYFHATGETIRDEDGNPLRVAGSLMDVTQTKNLIQEIQNQRMEAVAANKAKSTFLSTMSHEIRTPMNAILGITEIQLQNESLDPGIRGALDKIYASGDLLLGIINDILDLSKIEAGKLQLAVDRYEIASLVSDTAQLNMMRIGSKPIEFELNVDEHIPTHMSGDELRVKQICNNLLSNAFKYTPAGTVKLSVTAEVSQASDDEIILVIGVSDTGQGMNKEQINKLFDEYARFNMEANRTTEGTGLGMSITQNLIRLMGGEICVESEPGKGSVFTVRLPQGRVAEANALGKEMAENLHLFRTSSRTQMKRVQITREPMPYGSVLVVDDVETNIYVAKGLLTPYGLAIDSVDSGFAAIEKIKNGSVYDIVFMDHMMPKMDGIQATKIIRDMGYDHPVVALTANAVAGQASIFLANGFDDFISKPIDIRQLNAVLNKLIRDKQPPEVVEAARNQAGAKTTHAPQPAVDPRLTEVFLRDATRALETLEAIAQKKAYGSEDTLRIYVIHVHGLKSALANIGKMDLSAVALKLEAAGREGKLDIVTFETPAFLSALRSYVEEITPRKKEMDATGDEALLREQLLMIKTACEEYDESAADALLTELRKTAWAGDAEELLSTIAEQLLHSDFDEIAEEIGRFVG